RSSSRDQTSMTDRAADVLARRLHDAGCRYAFGIPGGEVLTLVDALTRAGIQFVLAKHENSAGFMAEGIYHRTGAPGILVATLGPGVANAINVVANAEQDRVPLIFLTGCVDEDEVLTYTHQVFDHQQLLRPITRASLRLIAKNADVVADRAVRQATGARPGPVHVDVPISTALEPAVSSDGARPPRPAAAGPVAGPDLTQARRWLEDAERPLVMAGLEVLSDGAEGDLQKLVTQLNAPLITTYKAKGVLAEEHPLAMGGAGLSPIADDVLMPLVREADVIVAAGYDPIEMRTGWRQPWDVSRQHVIELTAHPNDHDMHAASLTFVGNVAAGLQALMPEQAPSGRWTSGKPESVKAALTEKFSGGKNWGPATAIATARRVLPDKTIAAVDSGAHRILLSQMWTCTEPRTLLQSTGLCTMGCGVPLALGAKIAEPERPCVAFTGDAGLLMILGELASAAELNLAIIVVVFVDRSLALIDMKQRQRQLQNAGVDFKHTDFSAVGEALGGRGVSVDSTETLETALTEALQAKTFTVIAVEIDREAYDGTF
ncbi:MAG: thiamine pyrophosphate-binding protein, partial [Hyphomicrobiaceae bacterium]